MWAEFERNQIVLIFCWCDFSEDYQMFALFCPSYKIACFTNKENFVLICFFLTHTQKKMCVFLNSLRCFWKTSDTLLSIPKRSQNLGFLIKCNVLQTVILLTKWTIALIGILMPLLLNLEKSNTKYNCCV